MVTMATPNKSIVYVYVLLILGISPISACSDSDPLQIKVPDYLDEINCQKILSEPNKETVKSILCDDYINNSLRNLQKSIPYKSWKLEENCNSDSDEVIITIRSEGVIPGASCTVIFDSKGELISKECNFNK